MKNNFKPVFDRLRGVLKKHAKGLTVAEDSTESYCLEGGSHPTHKRPMPIAWVKVAKNYVSYHLMPVYACPSLLANFSGELKARMQGKSCFNFQALDEGLFQELDQLTSDGFKAFREAGYLK